MSTEPKKPDEVVLLSDKPPEYQLVLKDRALSSTAEGITISDNRQPDNPIVYANLGFERLTGYAREDVLGRNCRFLQGEGTDPAAIETIRTSIQNEKSCSVEILNYRKDGTPFWNLLSITPIRDTSGRVTNFIGIQSDITERKEYELRLKEIKEQLEAKNARMKRDLEDARALQLAMLPDQVPKLPYLEIAVSMNTAQEVGGDYYDFYKQGNELTFAFGDATGHGLQAGTIVTATKTLFNSCAYLDDPIEILRKMSSSLKRMGFRNMYMAMLMAKISRSSMLISSAGMPFTYVYKEKTGEVDEVTLKGMPLGSFPDFPYEIKKVNVEKGDTYLFHSDGLTECFNEKGEMLGERRVKEMFEQVASSESARIVHHLTKQARKWLGGAKPMDDITLCVMKRI